MNVKIFYHKDCSDGFGAAYAAWDHFHEDAIYEALEYGAEPDVEGVDLVYFVDVVPEPMDHLREIARKVGRVVIIDHHKTVMEEFQSQRWPENIAAYFDMNHSAAVLVWRFFHTPNQEVPELLKYVEDRDLWNNRLPSTNQISAFLRSQEFSFEGWDALIRYETVTSMARLGEVALATERILYRRAMEHVRWEKLGGYKVPIINTTVGGSDACHEMLEKYHVPVAGYYFDGPTSRHFGLRGDGSVDVGEIAHQLGGGGHKNAAGFSVPLEGSVLNGD